MNIIATMRELICRWQGHNVDAVTGVCHLCRQPILPPISTPESADAHQQVAAQTTYAVAPGEYLIEYADTHGLDEQGLADRLKFSRTLTRELLDGSRHLTESIAFDLQSATGISMNHWLALDEQYEKDLTREGRRRLQVVSQPVAQQQEHKTSHQPQADPGEQLKDQAS